MPKVVDSDVHMQGRIQGAEDWSAADVGFLSHAVAVPAAEICHNHITDTLRIPCQRYRCSNANQGTRYINIDYCGCCSLFLGSGVHGADFEAHVCNVSQVWHSPAKSDVFFSDDCFFALLQLLLSFQSVGLYKTIELQKQYIASLLGKVEVPTPLVPAAPVAGALLQEVSIGGGVSVSLVSGASAADFKLLERPFHQLQSDFTALAAKFEESVEGSVDAPQDKSRSLMNQHITTIQCDQLVSATLGTMLATVLDPLVERLSALELTGLSGEHLQYAKDDEHLKAHYGRSLCDIVSNLELAVGSGAHGCFTSSAMPCGILRVLMPMTTKSFLRSLAGACWI